MKIKSNEATAKEKIFMLRIKTDYSAIRRGRNSGSEKPSKLYNIKPHIEK